MLLGEPGGFSFGRRGGRSAYESARTLTSDFLAAGAHFSRPVPYPATGHQSGLKPCPRGASNGRFAVRVRSTYRSCHMCRSLSRVTEDARYRSRLRARTGTPGATAPSLPPIPSSACLSRGEVGPTGVGVSTVSSVRGSVGRERGNLIRPVLKHGPRSLASPQVEGVY